MKAKLIVIIVAAFVLVISIGTVVVLADPSNHIQKSDVFADTPTIMSITDGISIIHDKFPLLKDNLKYVTSTLNSDKSNEWLHFENDQATIYVNAKMKKVDAIMMKDATIHDSDKATIDLDSAQTKAIAWIKEYRPDFDLAKVTMTISEFHSYGAFGRFRFEWREYREGVDIGNTIRIELTANGDLASYQAGFASNQVDTSSAEISQDQAVAIAQDYINKIETNKDRISALKLDKAEKAVIKQKDLDWVIYFSSQPEGDPVSYNYVVFVDAKTGEVVNFMY